jgi:hypothetical protein
LKPDIEVWYTGQPYDVRGTADEMNDTNPRTLLKT